VAAGWPEADPTPSCRWLFLGATHLYGVTNKLGTKLCKIWDSVLGDLGQYQTELYQNEYQLSGSDITSRMTTIAKE